ncbi:MAG: imidazolonepropionase-like amidohydrolase [Alphaproteobacteria bacterium]|jgi:imidazolonepropionase-like amidohydrolase
MIRMLFISIFSSSLFFLTGCSKQQDSISHDDTSNATTEKFDVLFGGSDVGDLVVKRNNNQFDIDFGFSNNGRGASTIESLTVSDEGLPLAWAIKGKTVFGNSVDESFSVEKGQATWRASDGEGNSPFSNNELYVGQSASPYALFIYARALLSDSDNKISALPGGELSISNLQEMTLSNANTGISETATIYAINGIELDPSYIALDSKQQMLAFLSPRFALVRDGFASEDMRLRELAATLNAKRFETIAKKVTHKFAKIVRINNVRIFDPVALKLSEKQSVVVNTNQIVAIEDVVDTQAPEEVLIDGKGGTLIPGLFEMHGHISDNDALLNVMAGVTSVRDMGNEKEVLDALIDKIDNNILIGPRITKSGFIEGKSEFSAATGELASTKQEALDLVKMYGESGDYFQIKVYSSVNPDWVPDMAKVAKIYGMRVTGHIPAFSNVDEMIAAGYDEITHINQVMLSWVLAREEDTRTLFRITGIKRFVYLDLNSEKVQNTLNTMLEKNIAVDPTLVIHELGLTARNGETRIGVIDYIDNMPIGVQRQAKQALLDVADEDEDTAYRLAFAKVMETLTLMHNKGIFIVPGTDLGGAFELHRELELFSQLGMSNAEVLRRASYDMANYLGQGDSLGSIEVGKLADFFLVPGDPLNDLRAIKTVAMVVKDGNIYYPSQVYPEFGIKPFLAFPADSN